MKKLFDKRTWEDQERWEVYPGYFKEKWGLTTAQLAYVLMVVPRTLEKRLAHKGSIQPTKTELFLLSVVDWQWDRLKDWYANHECDPDFPVHPKILNLFKAYCQP